MLNVFASPFLKIRYIKETGLVLVQHYGNPYGNPKSQDEMSLEEFCANKNYSLYWLTALLAAGRQAALVA